MLQRGGYVPSRPSTTPPGRPQPIAQANLLQLPGLFGINRNGCSASAETPVRFRPKSVYDFVRNGCSFSPVIHTQQRCQCQDKAHHAPGWSTGVELEVAARRVDWPRAL